MPYNFGPPEVPLPLRICRSLVWAQAAYTVFAGVFILLIAVVIGGSSSIPFRGGTLAGSSAALLGIVYIVAALSLVWLGVSLGRRAPWARSAIVSMEVFLALVQLFRAFDLSLSTAINVALYVAIVALLFVPGTQRAFKEHTRA